jgi:hypothetical protein
VVARIVAVVAILAVVALYLYWVARRLDHLHARVDMAGSALDAQLRRRSAAVMSFAAEALIADSVGESLTRAAGEAAAVRGFGHEREVIENAVTRALAGAVAIAPAAFDLGSPSAVELHDEALRASFARRFYNDTVRDALVVRDRRVVRWLGLAGHAPHPAYFEMDDQELPLTGLSAAGGPTIEA